MLCAMVCVHGVCAYCVCLLCKHIHVCKSYRVCVCMLCVHGVGTPDTCVYIPLCVCVHGVGTPGVCVHGMCALGVCSWYVCMVCVCLVCVCVCLACVPSVPVCTHMCACACPCPSYIFPPFPSLCPCFPEVIPGPDKASFIPIAKFLHPPSSWQICCMPFLLEILDIKLKSGSLLAEYKLYLNTHTHVHIASLS